MIISDLMIDNFDYRKYLINNKLENLIGKKFLKNNFEKNTIDEPFHNVNPNNKEPFSPEFDDLIRLHFLIKSRKATTVLEYGVGYSSVIMADAILQNSLDSTFPNLRCSNLFELHSIDTSEEYISVTKKIIPKHLSSIINLHFSDITMSEFNGRICTLFDSHPNLSPDIIYVDGPDQFSPVGDIRGISTRHPDRMPMVADILSMEHFLCPGTLIVFDGRTANARFVKSNLQRNWSYLYVEEFDQHFFELLEPPLGEHNKKKINYCLGENYYKRLNKII